MELEALHADAGAHHECGELLVVDELDGRDVGYVELLARRRVVPAECDEDTARGGVEVEASAERGDVGSGDGAIGREDADRDALVAQPGVEVRAEGGELVSLGVVALEPDIAEPLDDKRDNAEELVIGALGDGALEPSLYEEVVLVLPCLQLLVGRGEVGVVGARG